MDYGVIRTHVYVDHTCHTIYDVRTVQNTYTRGRNTLHRERERERELEKEPLQMIEMIRDVCVYMFVPIGRI